MSDDKAALRETAGKIVAYVLLMSIYENAGAERFGETGRFLAAGVVFSLLLSDLRRKKDGFHCKSLSDLPYGKLLYLLPMLGVSTANLWHGAAPRFSARDTVFYIGAMLMIGAIEELLFRGYLLRALMKRSVKTAVLISSLTFGLGHIVNLVNGAEWLPTLLQLVYALAIGLMLSVFMLRAKNIIPCCVFHGVFNALAAFSVEEGQTMGYQVTVCAVITVLSVLYALYLWKREDLA